MLISDALMGFGIFGLAGYTIAGVIKDEGGLFNCFDIDQDNPKIKAIQRFWKELGNSIFGKDDHNNTDMYTQHTPEVIKKDSLSTK